MSFVCSLCGREYEANVNEDSASFTCWNCISFFLTCEPVRIKALYQRLIAKGLTKKAEMVSKWLMEEKNDGKPNIEREEISRLAKFALNKIGC